MPGAHRYLDEKGTRYYCEDDLFKLVKFRDSIKYGQMSEFSCKRWGKKAVTSSPLSKENLETSSDNNSIAANTNIASGNYDMNQNHPIKKPEDITISCTDIQVSNANSAKKFKKYIM